MRVADEKVQSPRRPTCTSRLGVVEWMQHVNWDHVREISHQIWRLLAYSACRMEVVSV